MSVSKNIAGVLALGTALSGAAVVLGGALAGTAGATTVMGGYVPAPSAGAVRYYPRNVNRNYNANRQGQNHRAGNKNKNRNKNKNKEWQHMRQSEFQDQFLMRDFTLVLTPFQKSSNSSGAMPWNTQWSQAQTYPYSSQYDNTRLQNQPRQEQDTFSTPETNQGTQIDPKVKKVDADINRDDNDDHDGRHGKKRYDGYPVIAR